MASDWCRKVETSEWHCLAPARPGQGTHWSPARRGETVLTTLNPAWGDTPVVMMAREKGSKEKKRGDTSAVTARA